jgi:hypothetical protein
MNDLHDFVDLPIFVRYYQEYGASDEQVLSGEYFSLSISIYILVWCISN